MSKRDELLRKIKDNEAYSALAKKLTPEELELNTRFLEQFADAFAPVLEAMERVLQDPALSQELAAALQNRTTEGEKDPERGKGST